MYCQACGTQIDDFSDFCTSCGHAQSLGSTGTRNISDQVKASSRDALDVFKRLLIDPVGGLSAAFDGLGPDRALSAGLAMCVAFGLAASGGVITGASKLQQVSLPFLGPLSQALNMPSGFGSFLKMSIQFLVLPAAIAAVGLGIRKIVGAREPFVADVFTAGAALAPLGLAILLSGLLGFGNLEIVFLLFFFAQTYLVLMLYAGFTRVGGMTEAAAAPAVPVAILLAVWLCKVVLLAVFL